jgi:hypothetical protein
MGNTVGTVSWDKSEHDVSIRSSLQALQETYGLTTPDPNYMEYDGEAKNYFGVEKRALWDSNDQVKAFLYDAEKMMTAQKMQNIKTYFTRLPM